MTEWRKPEIRPLQAENGQVVAGAVLFGRGEAAGSTFWCAHCGSSMNPTLSQLDLLEVVPYGGRPPRVGDVVVFLPPEGERPVVHRVAQRTGEGIRTRGDNASPDPWLLQPAELAGCVVAAWRGGRRRVIHGGWRGRTTVWLRRRWGVVDRGLSRLLHPVYRGLARSGLVRRLVPPTWRPRVALFQTEAGVSRRLLVGRRVVGWYDPRGGQWHIRRPYRLLVDDDALNVERGDVDR